jgi:hypothetical protein
MIEIPLNHISAKDSTVKLTKPINKIPSRLQRGRISNLQVRNKVDWRPRIVDKPLPPSWCARLSKRAPLPSKCGQHHFGVVEVTLRMGFEGRDEVVNDVLSVGGRCAGERVHIQRHGHWMNKTLVSETQRLHMELTFEVGSDPCRSIVRQLNLGRLPVIASNVHREDVDRLGVCKCDICSPLVCVVVVRVSDDNMCEYLVKESAPRQVRTVDVLTALGSARLRWMVGLAIAASAPVNKSAATCLIMVVRGVCEYERETV